MGKKNENKPKIALKSSKKSNFSSSEKIIIIDGQNVANYGKKSKPVYKNLFLVYKSLKMNGYVPKIVVSAALKYKIDNPVKLNTMFDLGIAIESPAGENDDLTILELSQKYTAKIISNDRYLDHRDFFPGVVNETIKFKITGNGVIFDPPVT
ncbi:MAG: hypothetical protein ACFFD4_08685 [Candidatus Odinarchaeota archaeon]